MELSSLYVKPTDEEGVCQYDSVSHRWLLDVASIKASFPSLTDEEIAKKRKSYSLHVYSWYRKYCVASCNWPFAEWALACTEEGKRAILEALNAQMDADSESGLDSVGNQVPVDFVSGIVMDLDKLAQARVSQYSKDILENLTLSFGSSEIMPMKRYDLGIRLSSSRYADWGY
jgi:hypothetical protein